MVESVPVSTSRNWPWQHRLVNRNRLSQNQCINNTTRSTDQKKQHGNIFYSCTAHHRRFPVQRLVLS